MTDREHVRSDEMNKEKLLIPVLMLGAFGILNTEMSSIGILPVIADRFSLSTSEAGLAVSAFSTTIVISALVTPMLMSRFDRKKVMVLVLFVFTIGNLFAMMAPDFGSFLASRIVMATVHPLFCAFALSVVADVSEPGIVTRNVSMIVMGFSAGMILGVPVTTVVVSSLSFEAGMLFMAAINAAVLLALLAVMPTMRPTEQVSYRAQMGILRKPVLWVSFACTVLLTAAAYGVYSYISEFLEIVTGVDAAHISIVLLVFGAMSIAGNVYAGRHLDGNWFRVALLCPLIMGIVYVLLFSVGNLIVPMMLIVLAWGFANGIVSNLQQYFVVSVSMEAKEFSNGLYLSMCNVGVTLGTSVCGMLLVADQTNLQDLIPGAGAFLVLAIISITIRQRMLTGHVHETGKTASDGVA